MGFWDLFRGINSYDPAQRVLPEPYEAFVSTGGVPVMDPGTPLEYMVGPNRSEIERFWRTQPNLRKVVDFIARSVASVPLNAFERVSDDVRLRLSDEPLSQALRSPQPGVSPFRFWHSVISDGLLYDRWAVLKVKNDRGGLDLVRVPAWRLRVRTDELGRVVALRYWVGGSRPDEQWTGIPIEDAIFDHGYAPQTAGLSPVETLRDVLDENAEAVRYRRQLWEQGVRVPGYIHRPANVTWEAEQRSRFVEAMRAYTSKGVRAGGLPLMEDGMELRSTDLFTPKDAKDIEGRQLTGIEVAAAYHIAPELVGAREGTYSNIDAFRQMLYGPNLGPYITAWEGALNAQLVPDFAGGRRIYIEANVESKLRGSFLEQATILTSAVGGPYMLRNEARALQNRAPISGGDELIVPMNVTEGGQASPADSGSQNRSTAPVPRVKAAPPEGDVDRARAVLAAFFKRQRAAVLSSLGAKAGAPQWWDEERWNAELGDDLFEVFLSLSSTSAKRAIVAAGGETDAFDVSKLSRYLRAKADGIAVDVNATTRDQITEALDAEDGDPAAVFDQAEGPRSAAAALTMATTVAGFATVEAAKQTGGATKTWSAGPRSRPSHARMDGETVAIEDEFSNGMRWPGDSSDADEVANCNCSVDFVYP